MPIVPEVMGKRKWERKMFAFFDGIMMRVTAVTLVSRRKDIKGRKSFSIIRGLPSVLTKYNLKRASQVNKVSLDSSN